MSQALVNVPTAGDTAQISRPAIELRGLAKTFGKGAQAVAAVDTVSLSVPSGSVFGLLGPNGAGKTTIIKMVAGLLIPTTGTALINGFDIRRQRSRAVQQIGAVLEGSRNVYWSLTAMQNLMYFGRLKGLRASEIRPRGERLLRELGLWERRDSPVGTFSRGMQQKVAIAAALVTDPPIVLLDEPTIGLDVDAAHTVKQWVTRLASEEGKTIILTTHQLAMAEELCERVAVIRSGKFVTDLPIGELRDRYAEKRYEVRIPLPELPESLVDDGMRVESADGQTNIVLPSEDQDKLHSLLARLHDRGIAVLAVNRVRPSLEEVFVRLVRGD